MVAQVLGLHRAWRQGRDYSAMVRALELMANHEIAAA